MGVSKVSHSTPRFLVTIFSKASLEIGFYVLLILGTLFSRLWDLGHRAMHHDESLHALYSYLLATGQGYRHDPMMHGPLQMEMTAGIFVLFGDNEFTARLLYALAGTFLVVMPLFLRDYLGRNGSLVTSAMLAASPAMFYFSRFARNDILMAVWAFSLVIVMWRFLNEGKIKYLYWGSVLLSLAFVTKESAYIVTTILGGYLFLSIGLRNFPIFTKSIIIGKTRTITAIQLIIKESWLAISNTFTSRKISREASFFIVLFTLSLPLGSALVSVFQDTPIFPWSNLVLTAPVGSPRVGAPSGGGLVVATMTVGILVFISGFLGSRWQRSLDVIGTHNVPKELLKHSFIYWMNPLLRWVSKLWNSCGIWYRCAFLFYIIFLFAYTTFFTNLGGLGSGIWQSLGYWLVQQDVARGNQPIYYYVLIILVYEFLPLMFSILGGIYYWKRKDKLGLFLIFWAVTTFILYSYITEKMPWLLVNLTLPLIVLSGKFVGDIVDQIDWKNTHIKRGFKSFRLFTVLTIWVSLLILTVWIGWRAVYQNGDVPVEMIVYTQTSPSLRDAYKEISKNIEKSDVPNAITIDQTGGFSWPWAWYLRDRTDVGYVDHSGTLSEDSSSKVLLLHIDNRPAEDSIIEESYKSGIVIPHRWWFPEIYRGLTFSKLVRGSLSGKTWRTFYDYFVYRKLSQSLGSEDVIIYVSKEIQFNLENEPYR